MDPFRLEEKLGSGAKSEVWRAVHTASGLPVAVKIITAREARRPEVARRIENEVRSIAALDHPNVIALFDYGRADGRPYLVMELASGGTLDRIKLRRYEDLRAILLALLDALAHAHARGVIHRDLAPRNILIAKKDDVRPGIKIADFGIALPLQRGPRAHSRENSVLGTLGYMAPEQLRARFRDYGPWTDLFSLGLIAQRLATGRAPYREGKPTETFEARLMGERAPLDPLFPLPLGFPEWLDRMLADDPARRIQCAADAASALAELGTPDDLDDFDTDGSSTVRRAIDAIEHRTISVAKSWRYPRPPPPPLPLSSIGARSVLEGTDEERDRIWELVQLTTFDGRAREAKSPLAEWVAERAQELGACTFLRATDGLGAMLDRFLHSDGLDASESLAHVRSRLAWYGIADEIIARALVRWMRPRIATEEEGLSADGLELLRKFIARVGEIRPVLIVFDHANADARAFMKYVVASEASTRVLFCQS